MKTLLAILLSATSLWAADDITFAWDASPDPGVSYVLEWGSAVARTNRLDAGTNLTVTLTNCPPGQWRAVCYAALNGLESEPSNEVTWTVKPGAPRNLRVTVQSSTNLATWTDGPALTIPLPPQLADQEFFRSRLEFESIDISH